MQHPNDDLEPTEILATRLPGTTPAGGDPLGAGARLGRYRLQSLLGRGGMGEVYLAEQLEPVRRTVALKLLRLRRLEARHLAYFEVERQLLAQMRHPAIAQIYDAGATAEGFPFFAMEYIEGSPVTRFCDERRLPLRQRIELFIRICEGVQHAHQKGVIHRDLKPGNILVDEVDGRPLPKIIDFGIATAASRALDGSGHERAGTPAYMSPEQAGDDPAAVDTRSDVYSLGVVLYELLTGQRPGAAGETAGTSRQRQPLPSEKLAALPAEEAARVAVAQGGSVAGLRKLLRNELDWVVAKATRQERSERYASAAELVDDLRRFLHGQPVLAVPASRGYVWGKFFGRHRTALIAAGVMLAALLGGLTMSLYGLSQARMQRAVAEQRSDELEKVVAFQQSMLESLDMQTMGVRLAEALNRQAASLDPLASEGFGALLARADTTDLARELVDHSLLSSAEAAIERDFADDPQLASELRESVARVQAALGLSVKAANNFGQVADYRSGALGESDAATLRARQGQVFALLAAADLEQAQALLQRSLPQAASLPANDGVRVKLQLAQAQIAQAKGDRERSKTMREELLAALVGQFGERDPAAMEVLNELAGAQRVLGELDQSRANLERLLPMRSEVLGAEHEDTLATLGNLAILRMVTGEKEGAVALQRDLTAKQIARLGAEHPLSLHARGTLANMLTDSGRAEEALPLMQSVLEARMRVLGGEHPQTIRARLNLATNYARLHDYASALPLEEQVIESRSRLLGPTHPDTVSILINHAGTLHRAGRSADTLKMLNDLVPLARQVLGEKHPQTQASLLIRAEANMALGRSDAAIAAYTELFDMRQRVLGDEHLETITAAWNLVDAYNALGQPERAASWHQRYLAPLLAAAPSTLNEAQTNLVAAMREGRRPGKE
ncbi:serine/threonine-protein kinase [Pseudoxanthomonas wuyuanensis]|uniref:Non-specific serine/threonine protein kinase/serine/threonine protein kinase n=1 Tax=Pseudoxanthomonas wuyuanensis TaxID=1073196 RepID=A0A286CVT7_9GAMM|nr:serine/threonine-protein kinase [Pseudoxanthomonas wuyuanensis]KAF1721289.1 serine/threonine protein kinase [Pseudoxanthomonas wuyuanensis]SOD50475.1 non-specific serine/threonine protein kinase/serine/threonine protein kinase [Pseudoxanthomonas wuyuanensis]